MRTKYIRPAVDYKVVAKSLVVPRQSMSIDEIVSRFMRGLPVNTVKFNSVYNDGNEDLEKVARMEFDDKAEYAAERKAEAMAIAKRLSDDEREKKAKRIEKAKLKAQGEKPAQHSSTLDNTMLHDTIPYREGVSNRDRNTKQKGGEI